MIRQFFTACLLATLPVAAPATGLSSAEVEGRSLAVELMEQAPSGNSSIDGLLKIRAPKAGRSLIPIQCRVLVTETNWQTIYETLPNTNSVEHKLVVIHSGTNANIYEVDGSVIPVAKADVSFAGSDFWLTDLGLEFLHWPEQTILKKELRRSRSCTVLESANPNPAPDGYSRVVSWVDNETGGIVHADAYDANGKKLKEFEPKEFKKVNGQWQLQEMEIRNVQTGSRTQLEFELVFRPDQRGD